MSRISALVIGFALCSLMVSAPAGAQQVPQAGAFGAGNSAISGVPYGPANPSVLSDPSGSLNASRMPPLGTNAPAPPTSYGSVTSQPPSVSRPRVVTQTYTSESPRFSGRSIGHRRPVNRGRGRVQTSSFTGICRGC